MSEEDIIAGEKVQEKIIQNIVKCDKLILCFTRENKKSPWLLYEAGFANGLDKMVIPFLFDPDPNWHSWIDNPINIAREINVKSSNFEIAFLNCFNLCDNVSTRNALGNFIEKIEHLRDKYRQAHGAQAVLTAIVHGG